MEHPLLDLLLNGAAFSEIIDKAEQVLGNPVAFIDTAQNETTLSAHYPREDMEDKAYRRQQISDEEYQKIQIMLLPYPAPEFRKCWYGRISAANA